MTITMTKTAYRGHMVASLRNLDANPLAPETGSGNAECNNHGPLCPHPSRCQPAPAAEDLLDSVPVEAPAGDPSPAQSDLMAKLIGELLELDRETWKQAIDYTARMKGRWTPGRDGNASRWIDRLITKLKELRAARVPVELKDGVYVLDGQIFKVQHAVHGSGRQYAKLVILEEGGKPRTEYAGTAPLKLLRPEHKMTAQDAAQFGQIYGMCVYCFRLLTDERSQEAGYGEKCAENHGLPWG